LPLILLNTLRLRATALIVAACLSSLFADALFADDFKLTKLEQDVLELRRDVQLQQRKLELLEQQLAQQLTVTPTSSSAAASGAHTANGAFAAWINHSAWRRIKPGMSEIEVVEILGAPTSMRNAVDATTKILFYTLEIGASGFLSGNVKVANHRVLEVQVPLLKVAP
jgi:hypothetical protein